MKLVIVESGAKATTIEKFLGPGYKVMSSYGHIRDLPRSKEDLPKSIQKEPWADLGVNTDTFDPFYIIPPASEKHVTSLRTATKRASEIFLATDEDREGEAIAWHLIEVLNPKVPVRRIGFQEITKSAIQKALKSPRNVNMRLFKAQEARRILDRLFGFSLSPVLWRKMGTTLSSGLSAGRVQSVALRLVVDREEERRDFKSTVFWGIRSDLEAGGQQFQAELHSIDGTPIAISRDFDSITGEPAKPTKSRPKVKLLDEEAAKAIVAAVGQALPWEVTGVVQKSVKQSPRPPFTTSTLQQAASGRLRSSPKKTMSTAQRLYEGVDLGGGEREGLITYMRTDSVTLSGDFMKAAGAHIVREFGEDYYKGPRLYKTKAKLAQEAHEAIRPTDVSRTPEKMARFLGGDDLKLYRLIWQRAVASQMTDALIDRTTVGIVANVEGSEHAFRATGSVLRFPGYLKVSNDNKRDDQLLPDLAEGDLITSADSQAAAHQTDNGEHPLTTLQGIEPIRRETKPPTRYTEAGLVKKLEEEGIGRPSTYAPTMSKIQDKNYVAKKGAALAPTWVGICVIQLLRDHFPSYIALDYTRKMEDRLDGVAAGKTESTEFLANFYNGNQKKPGLEDYIKDALPEIKRPKYHFGKDPETGKEIWIWVGRSALYAQLGDGDTAERVTLPSDKQFPDLTVKEVPERIKEKKKNQEMDRKLGEDPDTHKPVYIRFGPYGPYVQLGDPKSKGKPRRVSIPKGVDPLEVALDYALKLLSLPRILGNDPEGKVIKVGQNRHGPYVQRDRTYANIPGEKIFTITMEEALEALSQKADRGPKVLKTLGPHPRGKKDILILDGRYGPYVTNGTTNANVPKDRNPDDIEMEEALTLLAAAAKRKKAGRGGRRGRPRK